MSCKSVSITRMDGQRLYLSIKGDRDDETLPVQSKVNMVLKTICVCVMLIKFFKDWFDFYVIFFVPD